MSLTTFSGPVRSLAGFISGTDAVAPSVTSATLTIDSANIDAYNGKVIPLNRAGGITVTLPNATGSQAVLRFVVGTTFTSNGVIKVARAADTMAGTAVVSNATASTVFGALTVSDTITMNGTTTGGLAGSYIELYDVATGDWIVRSALLGSGVIATPFSESVS